MTVQPGRTPFADEPVEPGHDDAVEIGAVAGAKSAEPLDAEPADLVEEFVCPMQSVEADGAAAGSVGPVHPREEPGGNHPAVARAAELLDGIGDLPVDEHSERYELAHGELQAALADAEPPGPVGAR
ncbi:MAG: hypothetical protein ACR2KJ_09145 [Jatrophihabitans sp.]